MLILGGIGTGLVAGWVTARLVAHAPWNVRAWVLLSLIGLGLIVLELGSPAAAIGFTIAALLTALACASWVRSLERQYGLSE